MNVVIIMGSESDMEFAQSIAGPLKNDWGIESEFIVASAHKVPEKVFDIVSKYNASDEKIVYVSIAGRSNGLSGVVAANSVHPVLACPPFKDKTDMMVNINSTLQMPSDTPVLTVLDPGNCVSAVVRILALSDKALRSRVSDHIRKIKLSFTHDSKVKEK